MIFAVFACGVCAGIASVAALQHRDNVALVFLGGTLAWAGLSFFLAV